MSASPLQPLQTVHLLREVDEALIPLLRGLEPEDWARPAVGSWSVRDVAAHLLDGAVRRLSCDRDGHKPSPTGRDLSDHAELVSYLNDLNAAWVLAAERLSTRVLTDLLELICPQLADHLASLDPEAEATFAVSWAGEDSSKVWMDVAREYTERWHHQQQIREAVRAPGLDQERFLRPLLETLVRAVPRSYDGVEAPAGTTLEIRITDLEGLGWILERQQEGWRLAVADRGAQTDATIRIAARASWRLFTKGLSGSEARQCARVEGEERWIGPFFHTLAIMA